MSRPTVLETERVRLRPLRADDLHDLHATVLGDPAVTWDHRGRTLEEAARRSRPSSATSRSTASACSR